MAGAPNNPILSAAVQDLGPNQSDTLSKLQREQEAMKRRKQSMGEKALATPLGSASVMSLTGNQY